MYKRRIIATAVVIFLVITGIVHAQQPGRANDCIPGYLPPRLYGGMMGRVTPGGTANRIRANPTYSAEVVGSAPPETPLYITTAPACADGVVFWQVQFRDINTSNSGIEDFGWTAEGDNGEYWLEPTFQTWNIPTSRAPISTANFNQMQNLGQVQYGMVSKLIWSPTGEVLAINTVGAIWLHNVAMPGINPLAIAPNQLDTNRTNDMVFSPLGNTLITLGDAYQTWNLLNGTQVSISAVNAAPDSIKALGSSGTIFATGNPDGSITLYDAQTNQPARTLTGHSLVGALIFNSKGTVLVSGGGAGMAGSDNTVRLWDIASGNQIAIFDVGQPTQRLAFAPNGNILAIPVNLAPDPNSQPIGGILLVDMNTRSVVGTLQLISLAANTAGLTFSADGSILAVAEIVGTTGQVSFFDVVTGTQIGTITVPAALTALAFSPDGTLLALAYEDPNFWGPNRVEVWGIPQ